MENIPVAVTTEEPAGEKKEEIVVVADAAAAAESTTATDEKPAVAVVVSEASKDETIAADDKVEEKPTDVVAIQPVVIDAAPVTNGTTTVESPTKIDEIIEGVAAVTIDKIDEIPVVETEANDMKKLEEESAPSVVVVEATAAANEITTNGNKHDDIELVKQSNGDEAAAVPITTDDVTAAPKLNGSTESPKIEVNDDIIATTALILSNQESINKNNNNINIIDAGDNSCSNNEINEDTKNQKIIPFILQSNPPPPLPCSPPPSQVMVFALSDIKNQPIDEPEQPLIEKESFTTAPLELQEDVSNPLKEVTVQSQEIAEILPSPEELPEPPTPPSQQLEENLNSETEAIPVMLADKLPEPLSCMITSSTEEIFSTSKVSSLPPVEQQFENNIEENTESVDILEDIEVIDGITQTITTFNSNDIFEQETLQSTSKMPHNILMDEIISQIDDGQMFVKNLLENDKEITENLIQQTGTSKDVVLQMDIPQVAAQVPDIIQHKDVHELMKNESINTNIIESTNDVLPSPPPSPPPISDQTETDQTFIIDDISFKSHKTPIVGVTAILKTITKNPAPIDNNLTDESHSEFSEFAEFSEKLDSIKIESILYEEARTEQDILPPPPPPPQPSGNNNYGASEKGATTPPPSPTQKNKKKLQQRKKNKENGVGDHAETSATESLNGVEHKTIEEMKAENQIEKVASAEVTQEPAAVAE